MWFQWQQDYHKFHQCVGKNGNVLLHNHQLTKCKDPTGAGAVLRATFLVSKVWKDVHQDDFHLDSAETKTWVRLDGDLDTEVNYAYDDPNVVANGLGIMSKTFHEQQTNEQRTSDDDSDSEANSDDDYDYYCMSEEED
jgi:hypothetical protein